MKSLPEVRKRTGYHHGDLRAQLVEATRALVEKKGPDHFSVSEACRAAGVSTAAPYKHFKDKTEMLHAVAHDGMSRQFTQMQVALEGLAARSIDRIVALGRVYVSFAVSEPGVFRLMFGLSNDHDRDDDLVRLGHNTFGLVKREVAEFAGHDSIQSEDEHRAFLLWSFVHGLSFLLIDGKVSKVGAEIDLEHTLTDISRRIMTDA